MKEHRRKGFCFNRDKRILKDRETSILVRELANSRMVLQLRIWVKGSDQWGVYFDVIEARKKRFDVQGITIPLPQKNVHIYDHKRG